DLPGDVPGVALSRDGLDDSPQDTVSEIRVGEGRPGVKIQGPPESVANDVLRADGEFDAQGPGRLLGRCRPHRIKPPGAIPPRGVLQAMTNGDPGESRVGALPRLEVRHHLDDGEDLVVEFELAPFDEPEDGNGGDRLADAGDAEPRGRLDRLLLV